MILSCLYCNVFPCAFQDVTWTWYGLDVTCGMAVIIMTSDFGILLLIWCQYGILPEQNHNKIHNISDIMSCNQIEIHIQHAKKTCQTSSILEKSDVLMFIQFLSISAEEFVQEQGNLIPPALGYSRHQGILKKQMRTHHLKPEKPYVNLFVQISWGTISINIFIICIYAHVNTHMYCI